MTVVQPRIPPAPLLLAKPLLPQQRKVILQSLNIKFNTVYSQKNQWGLNLAVWRSIFVTANIMTLYMYGIPILNCQIYVRQYLCSVCHSHQYFQLYISIVVTYVYIDPSGYDPPVLDGPNACPHCHLSPCVIERPPSWVRGSSAPSLGKRFTLYGRFWTFLRQLGVWNHPTYLQHKRTKTSVMDTRDVLPACVVRISLFTFITIRAYNNIEYGPFRRCVADSLIHLGCLTPTSSHRHGSLLSSNR